MATINLSILGQLDVFRNSFCSGKYESMVPHTVEHHNLGNSKK